MVGVNESASVRICGLTVTSLKQIVDERGAVLHMLRSDSELFHGFGEIYFSEVLSGTVKAWKCHRRMTQYFAVPHGRIKLVLFDDRDNSDTQGTVDVLELGRPDRYCLVRIPPGLWYGFQGIAAGPSLLANCTDLPHDPSESDRLPENATVIPYRWS